MRHSRLLPLHLRWKLRRGVCSRAVLTSLLAGLGLLFCQASRLSAADYYVRDFSANTHWFPSVFRPYIPQQIPPPDLNNTKTLSEMIRDGKIELSLSQLVQAVIDNNLDIAAARYNNFFAQADVLRVKGGQAARGVESAGVNIPNTLFAAAIGAGVGNIAGLGGLGLTGSISGQGRTLNITPRGAFDPAFIFNFSWDRTTSPLNTLVVAGSPTVIPTTTFVQFGYQQAFSTGTSFSVQMSNQRQSTTQLSLLYNPDVISRMSINVVQQLMNGFGFNVNRRFLSVARNDQKIVRQWFRQQVSNKLAQAQSSYWDLVAAQEQVREADQALKVAEESFEETQKREQIGVLAPLDVTSAEAEMAARQRDLIIAQTNLQTQEMNLKDFFSKEITDALGAARIIATDPLPSPQDADIPTLHDALPIAMQNRPELPQAEGAVTNDEVAVKFTRNFTKPTVNAFALLATAGLYGNRLVPGLTGGPPVLIHGGLAQELNQFIHFKYPEYAVGMAVTIPLRNRSAQADSTRAQLDERQAESFLQRSRNQIESEVRNAIISLMQSKARVEAAQKTREYNQQTADAERKKLIAGVSTPYNVILAQRDLLSAQFAEVQARAAYAKARVEMSRSTGVILEENHIDVDQIIQGTPSTPQPPAGSQ